MIKLKELNAYINFSKQLKNKIEKSFEGCSAKLVYQISDVKNVKSEKLKDLFCSMYLHVTDSGGNDFYDIKLDDGVMSNEPGSVDWEAVFHEADNRVDEFIQTGGKRINDGVTLMHVNEIIQEIQQYAYKISNEFEVCQVELKFDSSAADLLYTMLFDMKPTNLILNIYDVEGHIFEKINIGCIDDKDIIEQSKTKIDEFISNNK